MKSELLNENYGKSNRTLSLYSKLTSGKIIVKKQEADWFGVSEKSIQRDLDEIRLFLEGQTADEGIPNELIYDRALKGYRLKQAEYLRLTNPEILAISKILLDSRAFTKDKMSELLTKLIDSCVPIQNQEVVKNLIRNEEFHYIQPKHGKDVDGDFWKLGLAVYENKIIEFDYKGVMSSSPKHRRVEPLAIMFSEYYFYLVGIIENIDKDKAFSNPNDIYPTIYRIDRIKNLKVTKEHFKIPYKDRFEEGEFRKKIQFMYGGKLRKVKFQYTGFSVEAVLDRLPTAQIISEEDGVYTITAEVFGDGIDMWLRSQGDYVKII